MALFLSAKLKKLNFDHYKEEKLLYRMNQKQQKPVPQSNNIQVYIRVRPFNSKQRQSTNCIVSSTQNSISIRQRQSKQNHDFTFDKIFKETTTQQEVYEDIGTRLIQSSFQGINGTIFCYGQTSSGKTHTCIGPNFSDSQQCGILPRLIKQTLQKIQQLPKNIEAKMKISMVQIYNEKIKDLLDPSKVDLKIRSNQNAGIHLDGVTEKYILTKEQAFQFLQYGLQHRSVSFTNMNARSSRSHMMFLINLYSHDVYTGQAKTSKITLIDLAGSQKISKTGAEGKILQEAKKINTSLTALGKVISTLSEGKSSHVPYRDSKLTRLLQQSLGGNSFTKLIINVSPSTFNDSETLTSIRFGWRAKAIKNAPKVNKSYTVAQLLDLLEKAEKKIKDQSLLIKELNEKKKRSGGYGVFEIPKMITMHLLKDEDQDSSTYNSEDELMESQEKIDNNSEPHHSLTEICEEQEGVKFSQTAETWKAKQKKESKERKGLSSLQEPKQKKVSFNNFQNCLQPRKCEPKTEKMEENPKFESKYSLTILENVSLKIEPSKKEVDIEKQNMNCLENLDAIKRNLALMKQKFLQIQKENKKKEMIIQRKNFVIAKLRH